MKWRSPFLLLLIAALTGCTYDIKPPVANSRIPTLLDSSYNTKLSPAKQLNCLRKATTLIKKSGDLYLLADHSGQLYYLQCSSFPDSTSYYLQRLQQNTIRGKHKSARSFYYLSKADFEAASGNTETAFFYYSKAKLLQKQLSDSVSAGYSAFRLAHLELLNNDYNGAESSATEALQLLRNSGNKTYLREVFNILGNAYNGKKEYDLAISNYKHGLEIADDLSSKEIILNNIASVHILKGDFKQAVNILLPLSQSQVTMTDTVAKARVLDNLGYSQMNLGTAGAFTNLSRALEIRERNKLLFALPSSYIHLASYYKNEPLTAYGFAEKAYKTATLNNSVDDRLEALTAMSGFATGIQLTRLLQKRIRLTDSIVAIRALKEGKFAKLRYDFSEKSRELDKAIKDNEINVLKARQTKLILFSAMVLLVCSGGILIYRVQQKRRKEKQEAAYKAETRISKKIHDELANDVFHTLSFAERENLGIAENKDILMNNLDDIYSRTRDISRENTAIDTGDGFTQQLTDMINGYQSVQTGIVLVGLYEIPWSELIPNVKIEVYRILQELLTNMKKHSKCHRAVINFKNESKKITIAYADDGVGITSGTGFSKNGLLIMENRIQSIKGNLTFETKPGKGFKATFTFPQKQ